VHRSVTGSHYYLQLKFTPVIKKTGRVKDRPHRTDV